MSTRPTSYAKVTRRQRQAIVIVCLLAVQAFTSGCLLKGEEIRPNIVLIFVDDLGYNDVSYNGATEIETPNIDRLADEGIIFSNGYIVHPTCGPSRAGLITGRYPARFGMEANLAYAPFDPEYGLPVEETTVAAYLKDMGYQTGIVGKWQLGAAPPFNPLNRGFDYFYGFLGGEHNYFAVDGAHAGPSQAVVSYLPLNENRSATGFDGYLTDVLTDHAIEFVHENRDEPFFLYLAYNAPHTPLQAPENLVEKYSKKLTSKVHRLLGSEQIPDDLSDQRRHTYLAMISSLDQNIGRVLDTLAKTGERDNTLIFFLSDNGGVYPKDDEDRHTWADNSPFSRGKNSFFEGGIRVPFVASWPARWPQGETFEPMVSSLDIAATAMALTGSEADASRPLDGVNLDPFLRGETAGPPHEALFWRQANEVPHNTLFAVRTGSAKLIRDREGGAVQLFDLERDPSETRNLIDGDPQTAARLAELWNAWNRDNVSLNIYPGQMHYESIRANSVRELAEDFNLREAETPPFQIGEAPSTSPSEEPAAQ